MQESDVRISNAISRVQQSVQDIKINGDLVQLRFSLKELRANVDAAYLVVKEELSDTRLTRRQRTQNATLQQ